MLAKITNEKTEAQWKQGYKAPHKHVDCKSSLLTLGLIRGEALTGRNLYQSRSQKILPAEQG
jgi:hypothetical protein